MKSLLWIAYRILRVYWFVFRPITLGVRLLPVRGDQVVLVHHSYQNAWYLPGGGVKRGETLEQAMRREAREEFGATLGSLQLFGVYTSFAEDKNDHITVFVCQDFEFTGKSDGEIEAVAWFPLDQLPPDISPACRRRIEEYQQGNPPGFGMW